MTKLQELSLMQIKPEKVEGNSGTFVIEPLLPGFGLTIGNAMRRVLLSSLEGAAITSVRIDGVTHEFSTIDGVVQDVVDIILNLKQVRFKIESDEPQMIILEAKGKKKVTAGDFKCPTGVEIVNKDLFIAELSEKGKFMLEATVQRGRGYLPTELRKEENLPIGVIALDASFSPVSRVNFNTQNTRVGKMTNFDKLLLEIDTDGTITPQVAMEQAASILVDHFNNISGGASVQAEAVVEPVKTEEVTSEEVVEEKPKKARKTVKKEEI